MYGPDDDREVVLDDDIPVLADRTSDDTDRGWGEWRTGPSDEDRLREDRPPHWD